MLRRLGVGLAAALCSALLVAWVAPALLAPRFLPAQVRRYGVELELSGVHPPWPLWPLGFVARGAALRSPDATFELADLRTFLDGGDLLARAQLGSGSLEARTRLGARSGLLFARSVPLESLELPTLKSRGVTLRGRITGVAELERDLRFSARVQNGSLGLLGGMLPLPMQYVSVLGEWRRGAQVAHIEQLEAAGPDLELAGRGDITRSGELALQIEVRRVEERLLRTLRLLGIKPPPRLPARYALVGPWQRARLELLP